VEGVHAVVSGADIAGLARPITCNSLYPSWQPTAQPALAIDRVRFVGEAVAAVVADDRYIAEDAADLVLVATSPLEVLPSVQAAIRPGAIRLHAGWEDNFFVKRHIKAGEPDRMFDEAHGVWGLASYAAVLGASKDPSTFSSTGGIRPDSGPLPMMIDMDDPEHWTRRILSHCGLPEEEQVHRFHETDRVVATASALQVRRPINRSGIGVAQPYREHLQPFVDAYRALGGTI